MAHHSKNIVTIAFKYPNLENKAIYTNFQFNNSREEGSVFAHALIFTIFQRR